MKIEKLMKLSLLFFFFVTAASAQNAEELLLKNFRPVSIFNVPVTHVQRAAYPVIDAHSHDYARDDKQIVQWVEYMDACGIEKTIILTSATGAEFDSINKKYKPYSNRFEIWCGFDYTGYDKPGYGPAAVKELERCYKMGARGVGELGDKGLGMFFCQPQAWGMHPDDKRMKPLYEKCAELKMPINIHVADPVWMYEKMDSTNDGLMNAEIWKIDMTKQGILGLEALVKALENALRDNPKTTFIATHFANLNHDMDKLGTLLDKYPNFYADIAARYAESAPIPRYMKDFYEKYQDRLLYGTDMGIDSAMYTITFSILESNDEHFYETELFGYHWAMNGFGLSKDILKKVYRDNALKLFK